MEQGKSSPLSITPLKIKCSSTNCDGDLHCFRRSRKLAEKSRAPRCISCGVDLIDWSRLHVRSSGDAAHTFQSLKRELIRHYFWHVTIEERVVHNARRMGRRALATAAKDRIVASVGPKDSAWDGRQTPFDTSPRANIITYAQHATASCCRKCIEIWHGISRGRLLDPSEVTYLTELIVLYINERLPLLTNEGEPLPRFRIQKMPKVKV